MNSSKACAFRIGCPRVPDPAGCAGQAGKTIQFVPVAVPPTGATLLKDSRVLIAGGLGTDGQLVAESELYDSGAGRFSTTGTHTCGAGRDPRGKRALQGAVVGRSV